MHILEKVFKMDVYEEKKGKWHHFGLYSLLHYNSNKLIIEHYHNLCEMNV